MTSALELPTATTSAKTPKKQKVAAGKIRRHWVSIVVLAAIAGGGAVAVTRGRARAAVPVTVVTAEEGTVRDFVTSVAAGRVAGKRESTLKAEIAGRVLDLPHRRGDVVAAGAPLVVYDADDLRERLRVAESAVAVARAQQAQAAATASLADVRLARAEKLDGSGAIPRAELDEVSAQSRAAARAHDAATASLAQARATVDLAKTALGKAVVRAPFAGTVFSTSIEVGEATVPGTPVVAIADTSELHVDVDMDEADVGRIGLDMPADVSLDAFPGERVRGRVREIAPGVTRDARGGRSVAIEVALAADARFRVGMSADVDVVVATRERVTWLPPSTVQGRGANRVAYVVKDGVVSKRTLDIGIATWEAVEIKQGVTRGENVVVLLGTLDLANGTRVDARPARANEGSR